MEARGTGTGDDDCRRQVGPSSKVILIGALLLTCPGVPTHTILDQTGHRSNATLAKYVRPRSGRKTPSQL